MYKGRADATPAAVQNLSEVGRVRGVVAGGAGGQQLAAYGIIVGQGGNLQGVVAQFLAAVAHHRFWGRPLLQQVPA